MTLFIVCRHSLCDVTEALLIDVLNANKECSPLKNIDFVAKMVRFFFIHVLNTVLTLIDASIVNFEVKF